MKSRVSSPSDSSLLIIAAQQCSVKHSLKILYDIYLIFLCQAIDVHIPKKIANCITVAQLTQMIVGLTINVYTSVVYSKRFMIICFRKKIVRFPPLQPACNYWQNNSIYSSFWKWFYRLRRWLSQTSNQCKNVRYCIRILYHSLWRVTLQDYVQKQEENNQGGIRSYNTPRSINLCTLKIYIIFIRISFPKG